MGNDIFMGGIKFTPDFDNMSTQDQWYDMAGGAGKLLVGVSFQPSTVRPFLLPFLPTTTIPSVSSAALPFIFSFSL